MSLNPRRAHAIGATITQLGREFGVTARALRYYEEQGLLSPARPQQMRVYSHRDRVRLSLVLKGRKAGLTLREIRELLEVYDKDGLEAQQARALPRLRAQLAALEQRRCDLDAAIETLKGASDRLSAQLSADPAESV
jgi:DNA-binding transcriptional MerR regulator